MRRLGEQGCTYLQFDDTSLAYLNDPHQREYVASIGGDPDRQHVEYIHHINEALAGRPDGMAVTTHMCRGNFRSSWAAEGGYDFVAEALFNELEVDGFFMEWDDERSGGFEPLRFVPKGKLVVLGLVTTKRGELEAKDELKRRVEEASRFVRRRPALSLAAVRLLVDGRGQRALLRGPGREAAPDRRDRARDLGLTKACPLSRQELDPVRLPRDPAARDDQEDVLPVGRRVEPDRVVRHDAPLRAAHDHGGVEELARSSRSRAGGSGSLRAP